MEILISAVCGLISLALVAGLIFNEGFRNAVLGGQGEATVFGLITLKGVAIVVLSGMFLAGMLYPLYRAESKCMAPIQKIETLLNEKFYQEIQREGQRDPENLKRTIENLQAAVAAAKQCY